MGSEWGQGSEWSADNGLDWWVLDFDVHQGVQRLSRDLNAVYRRTPALWQLDSSPEGFSWIDANDAQGNTLSFLRMSAPAGGAARGAAPFAAPRVSTCAAPRGTSLAMPPPLPGVPGLPIPTRTSGTWWPASPTSPRCRT